MNVFVSSVSRGTASATCTGCWDARGTLAARTAVEDPHDRVVLVRSWHHVLTQTRPHCHRCTGQAHAPCTAHSLKPDAIRICMATYITTPEQERPSALLRPGLGQAKPLGPGQVSELAQTHALSLRAPQPR